MEKWRETILTASDVVKCITPKNGNWKAIYKHCSKIALA